MAEKTLSLFKSAIKVFSNLIFNNTMTALKASLNQTLENDGDRLVCEYVASCIEEVIQKFCDKVDKSLIDTVLNINRAFLGVW